jgi:hypothetical protein
VIDLTKILLKIYPTARWTLNGDFYDGLTWLSEDIPKPTQEELELHWITIENSILNNLYVGKRQNEYPNFLDYIDGVVKNDQAQIDKYIQECLSVKLKYPKSSIE